MLVQCNSVFFSSKSKHFMHDVILKFEDSIFALRIRMKYELLVMYIMCTGATSIMKDEVNAAV